MNLIRELRDCLNVQILRAMEIGDTSYNNHVVFGVLGQLFKIKMLLNRKLIKAISNYCPKLIKLTMDVDHKNLEEMTNIFSSCTQLEKLFLTTKC